MSLPTPDTGHSERLTLQFDTGPGTFESDPHYESIAQEDRHLRRPAGAGLLGPMLAGRNKPRAARIHRPNPDAQKRTPQLGCIGVNQPLELLINMGF